MTITLELTPDAEERLQAQARACGLTLDAFVQSIVATQAAAGEPFKTPQAQLGDLELRDQLVDEVFDSVPMPSGVGKGAMHRENWYR